MKFKKLNIAINTDILKILALISMTVDHIARKVDFSFSELLSHSCGRVAFPIFIFLLTYNLIRVKDKNTLYKKYTFRLLFTGILTFTIDFFIVENPQINIMFSLFLIVAFIYLFEKVRSLDLSDFAKNYIILIILGLFTEISIFVEYQFIGFFYGVLFYFALKNEGLTSWFYFVLLLILAVFINFYSLTAIIFSVIATALLFLSKNYLTSKTRIIKKWWIFYLYYPLHRALITLFL